MRTLGQGMHVHSHSVTILDPCNRAGIIWHWAMRERMGTCEVGDCVEGFLYVRTKSMKFGKWMGAWCKGSYQGDHGDNLSSLVMHHPTEWQGEICQHIANYALSVRLNDHLYEHSKERWSWQIHLVRLHSSAQTVLSLSWNAKHQL